jgi:hypothetical protein
MCVRPKDRGARANFARGQRYSLTVIARRGGHEAARAVLRIE